jgi:hypothetical protein
MTQQKDFVSAHDLIYYLGSGAKILKALGYDYIPTDHNPVWCALQGLSPIPESEIWEMVELGEMTEEEAAAYLEGVADNKDLAERLRPLIWKGKTPQKGAILHAFVVCQTACLNTMNGPIGDGALGTIRQRWYVSKNPRAMGFKMVAMALERHLVQSADVVLVPDEKPAQKARRQGAKRVEFKVNWSKTDEKVLAEELGRDPRVHIWPKQEWGRAYAQKHSQLLVELVNAGLTYEQLWVEDFSRRTFTNSPLVPEFYGVLVLEKEGLVPHFEGFCRAAGVPILVGMSGNNSFATTEAILNQNFRSWSGKLEPTEEHPLHLFCISDHDYAGHVPVQGGVLTQFERYLPGKVVLHRVGIMREQLRDLGKGLLAHAYEFDADHNAAYREWADEEGIWVGDKCYGIEVEALMPSEFIPYLIDAIVEALGGDEALRERLALMAEPDWWRVKEQVNGNLAQLSELYRRLKALEEWAETERHDEVERPVDEWSSPILDDEDGWRAEPEVVEAIEEKVAEQRESVDFGAFAEHVAGKGWSAWRPVSSEAATDAVVAVFEDHHEREREILAYQIDDKPAFMIALREVFDTLSYFGLEFDD